MTLTSGRGPLSGKPAGRFSPPIPDGVVYAEPYQRRVRGVVGGRTVIDCEQVVLVHRPGHAPTYAFPGADVATLDHELSAEVPGYAQVAWDAVDEWYEEEERVFMHPRNPYHRVDILRANRHLHVEVEGVVLVDTSDVVALYETALAPRLYVRPELVRTDLLVLSTTTTYCPYKGTASHWSAAVDGTTIDDVAWSYEDPLDESLAIRGMLSFYESRATVVHDVPAPAPL